MDRNLPATQADTARSEAEDRLPLPPRQPVSVAFLPLALVAFILLAFVMAAWSFIAAGS